MNADNFESRLRDCLVALSDLWREPTFQPYLSDGLEKEHVITLANDTQAVLPSTKKPIRGHTGVVVNVERKTDGSYNRIRDLVVQSIHIPPHWKLAEESAAVQERFRIIATRVQSVIEGSGEIPGRRERMHEARRYKHYEPAELAEVIQSKDNFFVFHLADTVGSALAENGFNPKERGHFDAWEQILNTSLSRLRELANRSHNRYEVAALLNGPPVDSEVGFVVYDGAIAHAITPVALHYADDALLSRFVRSSRSPVSNINTAIRYEVAVPVNSSVHDYLTLYTVATIVAETTVDIIRLVREDDIGIEGLEVLPADAFTPYIRPTYSTVYEPGLARYTPRRFAYSPPSSEPLSSGQVNEIRNLLQLYIPQTPPSPGVNTAMRRFRISCERYSPDDVERLLDIAIALETLLLADISGPRTELRYRLATRAAWFLGQSPRERQTYFKTMEQLYDIRSTIAHGDPLSQKQESIARELLVEAPRLLRKTLYRFVQGQGPQGKPGHERSSWWRDLVLDGGGPSS